MLSAKGGKEPKMMMMREKERSRGKTLWLNCFLQRQWGAIRVIKLISRTNKQQESEGKRERDG